MAQICLGASAELMPKPGYHSICALPLTPISHCASLPSSMHTMLWWYYYAIICLMQQLTVSQIQSSQQITKPPIYKRHNSYCSALQPMPSLLDFCYRFNVVLKRKTNCSKYTEERHSAELVKSNKSDAG